MISAAEGRGAQDGLWRRQSASNQPITFAVGRKPPALLITERRRVVDPKNSTRLADKLRSQGNTVIDAVYERFGHVRFYSASRRSWPRGFLAARHRRLHCTHRSSRRRRSWVRSGNKAAQDAESAAGRPCVTCAEALTARVPKRIRRDRGRAPGSFAPDSSQDYDSGMFHFG